MNNVLGHVAGCLFILSVAALFGFATHGLLGMFIVLTICLVLWLMWHLIAIFKLSVWLQSPKSTNVPQQKGLWNDLFNALRQQEKNRKKRKLRVGLALRRFSHAAEAIPNGILVMDKNGRISWMNGLVIEHLNLNPQSDMGSILRNIVRRPEFLDFLNRPLEKHQEIKLTMPKSSGVGERSLLITRTPFHNDEELIVTRDISESEQLNATRTAFVANVSHELRTPLTVINGFLETMADMPDLPVEQRQQFIGLMQKEGSRMLVLLADLLTLSKLESGKHIESQPLDLSALVELLLEDGEALSAGKHTFSADIQPDLWIKGIYTDLYNGLSNLVFNAVHYTPEGGHISVSLQELPSENQFLKNPVRFAVEDNGPGIAPEHLPHITERFYRVDKGRSRQSGGTGLGLAITKHALAEHNAALEISSEVGVGSTFAAKFRQIDKPEQRLPKNEAAQ